MACPAPRPAATDPVVAQHRADHQGPGDGRDVAHLAGPGPCRELPALRPRSSPDVLARAAKAAATDHPLLVAREEISPGRRCWSITSGPWPVRAATTPTCCAATSDVPGARSGRRRPGTRAVRGRAARGGTTSPSASTRARPELDRASRSSPTYENAVEVADSHRLGVPRRERGGDGGATTRRTTRRSGSPRVRRAWPGSTRSTSSTRSSPTCSVQRVQDAAQVAPLSHGRPRGHGGEDGGESGSSGDDAVRGRRTRTPSPTRRAASTCSSRRPTSCSTCSCRSTSGRASSRPCSTPRRPSRRRVAGR